jgi:nicotinamide phosphoribosyltransferase
MLDAFDGKGRIVAVVSDSYDLDRAVAEIWGGSLRGKVQGREGVLVVRPDSGDPVETPVRTVRTLWEKFGGTVNARGYRVLDPHVRVIQGDGMNIASIARLVERMAKEGFALDNIAFGMGGGLLQQVNRDSLRFAMKANAMRDDAGTWRDVSKSPATDLAKGSKAGRQAVVMEKGRPVAKRLDALAAGEKDLLAPVWRDGRLLVRHTLDEVRARSEV